MTPLAPAVQPVQSFVRVVHVHPPVVSPSGLVSRAATYSPPSGRFSVGPEYILPLGIGKKVKRIFTSEVNFKIKTQR